jgi:hypothetical protein
MDPEERERFRRGLEAWTHRLRERPFETLTPWLLLLAVMAATLVFLVGLGYFTWVLTARWR